MTGLTDRTDTGSACSSRTATRRHSLLQKECEERIISDKRRDPGEGSPSAHNPWPSTPNAANPVIRIDRVWGELWVYPRLLGPGVVRTRSAALAAVSRALGLGLSLDLERQARIWSAQRQPCMIQLQRHPRRLLRPHLHAHSRAPLYAIYHGLPPPRRLHNGSTTSHHSPRGHWASTPQQPRHRSERRHFSNTTTPPHLLARRLHLSFSPTLLLPHPGAFLTVETIQAVPSRLCLPP